MMFYYNKWCYIFFSYYSFRRMLRLLPAWLYNFREPEQTQLHFYSFCCDDDKNVLKPTLVFFLWETPVSGSAPDLSEKNGLIATDVGAAVFQRGGGSEGVVASTWSYLCAFFRPSPLSCFFIFFCTWECMCVYDRGGLFKNILGSRLLVHLKRETCCCTQISGKGGGWKKGVELKKVEETSVTSFVQRVTSGEGP